MLDFLNMQADEGFGPEILVWLIIVVLWIVAQLVARAKQKSPPRPAESESPPEPPKAGESLDRKMRDFFEDIGGEAMVEEKGEEDDFLAPPSSGREPERPRRDRMKSAYSESADTLQSRTQEHRGHRAGSKWKEPKPKQPSFRTVPVAPLPPPPPSPITHPGRPDRKYLEVHDIDHHKQAPAMFSHALIDPKTLLVNLKALRMPIHKVPIEMLQSSTTATPRPLLKNRRDFRQAILGHIVLSPPLAMGEDKSAYTKKHV